MIPLKRTAIHRALGSSYPPPPSPLIGNFLKLVIIVLVVKNLSFLSIQEMEDVFFFLLLRNKNNFSFEYGILFIQRSKKIEKIDAKFGKLESKVYESRVGCREILRSGYFWPIDSRATTINAAGAPRDITSGCASTLPQSA